MVYKQNHLGSTIILYPNCNVIFKIIYFDIEPFIFAQKSEIGQKSYKLIQIDEKKKSPFAIWYRYVMRKWPAELDFFLWK